MSGGLVGRQVCACEVNSGEGMLAGGESMVRRMKFSEAAVVGGNDFFGCFAPVEGLLPGGDRQYR